MIKEFAKDPFDNWSYQYKKGIETTLKYLKDKNLDGYILDVGQRSPLTQAIQDSIQIPVYNTKGDLDTNFSFSHLPYDFIIYSHTIEHQFNPLYTLIRLRNRMEENTKMFIILPNRTKLLWDKGHYHEIDHYRMCMLLKRAGYTIISYKRFKVWRPWWSYLMGIRPLMRLFLEYNGYYEINKS